jgi:hypothetical protein
MCTPLIPGCLNDPGISTSHRKQYKPLSDISRYSHNGITLLAILIWVGRVSPKPATHIWACAWPCYLAAWTIWAFQKVTGSNTNYSQTFTDIDIMAVLCLPYLIMWERWIRAWLHIFGHVEAPAPWLLGWSGYIGVELCGLLRHQL